MIIIRYGELALKGKNRFMFENQLINNIKDALKKNDIGFDSVKKIHGRIFVFTENKAPCLSNVFGIVNYSYGIKCGNTLDDVREKLDGIISYFDSNTKFRVSTIRQYKPFPLTSIEIDKEIGAYIVEKTGAKVSLKKFDSEVGIEIYKDDIYIFADRNKSVGGMPVGSSSKVVFYAEDDSDLLGVYLMMKRGCKVILVSKRDIDFSWLQKYAYGFKLRLTIIVEMSDINVICEDNKISVIVLGQTLDNISSYDLGIVELRPLVAFSNDEIIRKISDYK